MTTFGWSIIFKTSLDRSVLKCPMRLLFSWPDILSPQYHQDLLCHLLLLLPLQIQPVWEFVFLQSYLKVTFYFIQEGTFPGHFSHNLSLLPNCRDISETPQQRSYPKVPGGPFWLHTHGDDHCGLHGLWLWFWGHPRLAGCWKDTGSN